MAGLLAVWIVLMFARQVNEAAAASERVDALISANAEARTLVSALDRERGLIARQRYVEQQARAFGLGQCRPGPAAAPIEAQIGGSPAIGRAPRGQSARRDDTDRKTEPWVLETVQLRAHEKERVGRSQARAMDGIELLTRVRPSAAAPSPSSTREA